MPRRRQARAVAKGLVPAEAELSEAEIRLYVASGEPMGKAGAYGVQGRAATLIARIEGSFSGIMGLPMYETSQLLRAAGFAI